MKDTEVMLFIRYSKFALLTIYSSKDKYFIHTQEYRQKPRVSYFPSELARSKALNTTVDSVQSAGWKLVWQSMEKPRG